MAFQRAEVVAQLVALLGQGPGQLHVQHRIVGGVGGHQRATPAGQPEQRQACDAWAAAVGAPVVDRRTANAQGAGDAVGWRVPQVVEDRFPNRESLGRLVD